MKRVATIYPPGGETCPRCLAEAALAQLQAMNRGESVSTLVQHVNTSLGAIAVRIATLRNACVGVWVDHGKGLRLSARVVTPWLPRCYRRASSVERELAARVMAKPDQVSRC